MIAENKNSLVITGAHNFTAVGHGAVMTASSVRCGLSRMEKYDGYRDRQDTPITVSRLRGLNDDNPNIIERMEDIAAESMEELLKARLKDRGFANSPVHLFIGAAAAKRPGPRYENNCKDLLAGQITKAIGKPAMHIIPRGNAAVLAAISEAGMIVEREKDAVVIIGGVDSLLRKSTLNWFEENSRLKSEAYGRHHGFIPGEAVGFLILEHAAQARSGDRPVSASIIGTGASTEPSPRASGGPCRATGLTEACRMALEGIDPRDITAVFTDQNGEETRSLEWSYTALRCFPKDAFPPVWHPADCYGDIGAASGAVLTSIVARGLEKGWLKGKVMVACSDDHGACGAVVLEKDNLP